MKNKDKDISNIAETLAFLYPRARMYTIRINNKKEDQEKGINEIDKMMKKVLKSIDNLCKKVNK